MRRDYDYYDIYIRNSLVMENSFIGKEAEKEELPKYEEIKNLLPKLIWEDNVSAINCYDKAWQLAFRNLKQPKVGSGFVTNYIDTAFNNHIFMWDSAFMMMFGKYGTRAFNFQETLDNFYSSQHPDGFICREIDEEKGLERFQRFDPSSTGPNVLPWAEHEYFINFGDKERLGRVFPALVAYHRWLKLYRTWQDGTYWSSGWGCGMDNQPRLDPKYNREFHHGYLSWIDITAQQVLSAKQLIEMSKVLQREEEVEDLKEEAEYLTNLINEKMWDEKTGFYYDKKADGSLSKVKSIGAYWTLISGIVPEHRAERFISHLENPKEFKSENMIPSLSKDSAEYKKTGTYWLGGVWLPTNYMVLKGLEKYGYKKLSHEISKVYVENVVKVFEDTGTLWENYAPEGFSKGDIARPDFVGWTAGAPITVLIEYLFGIRAKSSENTISWDVNLIDRHGVENYPLGNNGSITMICKARNSEEEEPQIEVKTNFDVKLIINWKDNSKVIELKNI